MKVTDPTPTEVLCDWPLQGLEKPNALLALTSQDGFEESRSHGPRICREQKDEVQR